MGSLPIFVCCGSSLLSVATPVLCSHYVLEEPFKFAVAAVSHNFLLLIQIFVAKGLHELERKVLNGDCHGDISN